MINKTFVFQTIVALLLLPQLSWADDFLDMLNAEAVSASKTSDVRIMDKIIAKDSTFIPKNKTEIEYKAYLKDKFHKTYLQYLKLDSDMRELVYEQYAKSSFPKIETTQKAIEQFLK
jgi:hypothetical protein